MPRTHAYGLPDLFALVARLLAPFVDPLRAEFASQGIDRPRPTTPPQPAPTPEPVVPVALPTADMPVSEPVIVYSTAVVTAEAENSAGEPERSPTPSATSDASAPVEPLFVRKPAGKKWRYVAAPPNVRGTTFRKLVKGRRTTYEPAR